MVCNAMGYKRFLTIVIVTILGYIFAMPAYAYTLKSSSFSSSFQHQAQGNIKSTTSLCQTVIGAANSSSYKLKAGFIPTIIEYQAPWEEGESVTFNVTVALNTAAPHVGTITPSDSTSNPEEAITFTTTYSDPDGWLDIQTAQFLVNTAVNGANCFFAYYDQNTNKLYLRDDAGSSWLGGHAPGSDNVIKNSYAELHCKDTSVSPSGDTLTVNWKVKFLSTFVGYKNIYLKVTDDAGAYNGWIQKGTWTIINQIPSIGVIPLARLFLTEKELSLLQEFLDTHLNYFLSEDVITNSGLPLAAYKEMDRGHYGYSSPKEWGYTLLAWIIAFENNRIGKEGAAILIEKALDTMLYLQSDPTQNYQKLFYPHYSVTDRWGNDLIAPYHDDNTWISLSDNALLYTSLLIIEGWAQTTDLREIQKKVSRIRKDMNFRIFLCSDKSDNLYLFHSINAQTAQPGSSRYSVYADEGGLMAWVSYLSGSLTLDEYKQLINSMLRLPQSWNSITVNEAAWFNTMFGWGVRSSAGFPAATWEADALNLYSKASFVKAVEAHLSYGEFLGIDYPAFSDAVTQPGMTGRYAPPNLPGNVPIEIPDHITPHALFVPFCIGPDLEPETEDALVDKITELKLDSAGYYHYGQDGHKPFGFEVTASPKKNDIGYTGVEGRYIYETLSNAYIVISLFQGLNINDGKPTLFHYASMIPSYLDKVREVLEFLYPSSTHILRVPEDYSTIQEAIDNAQHGDVIDVAPGRYIENIIISKSKLTLKGTISNREDPLNSGLNTIIDGNGELGIYIDRCNEIVLESLVITGANRDYHMSKGGGIFAHLSSDITIKNNIIIGNRAAYGAGICAYESKGIFISANILTQNDSHYGGPIYINFETQPE